MMQFRTDRARGLQMKFINEFSDYKEQAITAKVNKTNDTWNIVRNEAKVFRLELTDAVKSFVQYAIDQGSKNAKFYYRLFTEMAYKAIGLAPQQYPKARDVLAPDMLEKLSSVEQIQSKSIMEGLITGVPYKKLYKEVKKRILK